MSENKPIKTSIGGQAVIEGIMMKGPHKTALSVRLPNNTISTEEWETKSSNKWYKKTPFIRGVFNFVDSMTSGYTCLMKSAEKAGFDDEEPSKFELKLKKMFGDKYMKFLEGVIMVFAMVLAIGLFSIVPTLLVNMFRGFVGNDILLTAIEAFVKIGIFLGYLYLVSKMNDIERVFKYHGAEHKTIFCYENGEELTIENVRKYTRFHPRCGTSFLVIVLLLSILTFSFLSWGNIWIRIGLKILCLPLIMSVSYECIKLAGRCDNLFTKILSAPGLWTQRLTTREPDDDQIEVAIEAMKRVIPPNPEQALF